MWSNKIANLGTNVFQIARTPFAVTDFNIIIKALKYKKIELEDMRAVAEGCPHCEEVGATASATVRARYGDKEVTDVNFYGQTPSMADIDTRAVEFGRYFTRYRSRASRRRLPDRRHAGAAAVSRHRSHRAKHSRRATMNSW